MTYLTSAKKNVHLFVETCVAAGLKHVVISPGSRNAPLTITFDEHPEIKCYLVHDERSAGFFALGIALQLNEPVAVLCTSGSAVVNYFPAVTEAYYQCIPLVIISADRPQEWINHGDGQTIMQDNIFGTHVHSFLQLSDTYESEHYHQFLSSETLDILNRSKGNWRGPVHINFSLEEPLYLTTETTALPTGSSTDKHPFGVHVSTILKNEKAREIPTKKRYDLDRFKEKWSSSKKKIVLIGQMQKDDALLHELKTMVEDSTVLILVENTSNLYDLRFVHCIDRVIEGLDKNNLDYVPEILVTLGGAIVSKKIKVLLREWKIEEHWRVGHEFPEMNTYQKLTESVEVNPASFIRILNEAPRLELNSFSAKWKSIDFKRHDSTRVFCESAVWSDIKAFHLAFDYLPDGSTIHMGNSSVVRYAQLFDPLYNVKYQSNRGTSGIDGSMSTAVGAAAMETDAWHIHFTGDVSFFYDSNALWNQHITANLRIIMINNSGGGIFKIIKGPETTAQFEPYFVARHTHSAKHICAAFDIEYAVANDSDSFMSQMENFYTYEENGRPKLIEIFTNSDLNPKVLDEYFACLKQ